MTVASTDTTDSDVSESSAMIGGGPLPPTIGVPMSSLLTDPVTDKCELVDPVSLATNGKSPCFFRCSTNIKMVEVISMTDILE